MQRAADEHLPFAQQQRQAEAGEGEPEMGEDHPPAT
jgi:hypothetical protein